MTKLFRSAITAALLATMLLLAACSGTTEDGSDTTQGGDGTTETTMGEGTTDTTEGGAVDPDSKVNVYLYQAPVAWNPLVSVHGPDQQVMDLIFQKLIINNSDFQFEGRLAESWEVSDDAKTFTFHLYPGLTWNDGTPLTAEDVKFSFNLMADPDISASAGKFAVVAGYDEAAEGDTNDISGFQVIDDVTFAIELSEPNVGFLTTVASQSTHIVPQHMLVDIAREELPEAAFFREPTVGYGPYNFVSYEVDQAVELSANPDYHLGAPQIQTISLRQLTSDVAAAQLGTGEIDLAFISATDLEAVEAFDNVEIKEAKGAGFIRMAINHDDPRFQDPRVRQAMLYAIDRQGMIDTVLAGYGEVINVGYHSTWALPDDLNDYPYDPDKARELLAEAGWDSSEPVEIQWIAGTRDRDAIVPVIQQQWNEVGITTETVTVEVGVLLDKAENHTYDLTLFGGGDYSADPNTLYTVHTCDHLWMGEGWCNEEGVSELLEAWQDADATADPDERATKYAEISRTINEMVPYIWIYNGSTIWAHNERLQGFKAHGNFVEGFFNAHEWTLSS